MIKRFNPDFSLSISHELAYMRETPEGGYVAHGDYATLFSKLEVVKAERDALERQLSMSEAKCKGYFSDAAAALVRCDALAVENMAIKAMNDCLSEELRGYESDGAFEGPHMHLLWWKAENPATDAALTAIEARSITAALDSCSEYLDTDCVMDRLGISYADAELRTSGAMELCNALKSLAEVIEAMEKEMKVKP